MRDWTPGSPFRQRLGMLALLITWAAMAAWCWLRFHDGAMTHERLVMTETGLAFQFVPAIGYTVWKLWKAKRSPPVYRSTILD